jgi:type II secretory pathway pseudopilin PulG
MKPPCLHLRRNACRGFSLTELAIVFGVMGIILGGIWVYVGSMQSVAQRQQLAEELSTVVNNVHALYAGQAGIGANGDSISAVTPFLIQESAIPSTMVRPAASTCTNNSSLCADTPWGSSGNIAGGTFGVCAWTAASQKAPAGTACPPASAVPSTVQFFAIELSGISQSDCINLVPQDSGASGPVGLQDVLINGNSAVNAGDPLPVLVSFATANCTSPAANIIDFVYRLQAPTF